MTAKPRAPEGPASIVDSLQSEVSAEASPLLAFLIAHAAKIAALIVLFIVGIGVYWFYASHSEGRQAEEYLEFGKIQVISDPKLRLEKLEAFVTSAPESVKRSAWFAMLDAAHPLEDMEKVYSSWSAIREFDTSMLVTASLGMANSLSARKQYREALEVLDSLTGKLKPLDIANVNIHIVLLAELLGDYKRAIEACDVIIREPSVEPIEVKLWVQKKAELEQKLPAE